MRNPVRVLPFVVLLLSASTLAADAVSVRHKGIVPIIGSTGRLIDPHPAFQSTITLYGKQGLRGRIVFHPAGQVANDDTDPSFRYLCASRNCFTSDSVTASVGITGAAVGSLDIIPDPDSDQTIPMAFTRIYYSQGAIPQFLVPFGTDVPRVISDEWVAEQQSGDASHRFIYVQGMYGGAFRTTLGMRTLTDITYSVTIVNQDGIKETIVSGATLPANFTYFVPLQQVLGSRVLGFGEDVRVDIESGSAIGFYSYTSNATNDPNFRISEPLSDPVAFGGVQ
jgi:hypothetical protein